MRKRCANYKVLCNLQSAVRTVKYYPDIMMVTFTKYKDQAVVFVQITSV